jgi:hypothetical protein
VRVTRLGMLHTQHRAPRLAGAALASLRMSIVAGGELDRIAYPAAGPTGPCGASGRAAPTLSG